MRAPLDSHRAPFILLAITLLLAAAPVSSSAQEHSAARTLYLVGAVNMEFGVDDPGSPVVLYRVGDARRLQRVREITAGHKSGSIIASAQDAVFVAYPALSPTTVSVLHFSDPLLKDEIAINPTHLNADTTLMATAATSPASHSLLLPLITIGAEGTVNKVTLGTGLSLLSIRSSIEGDGPRIRSDTWDDYSRLRYEGLQGSPGLGAYPEARVLRDHFIFSAMGEIFEHPPELAPPPPGLKEMGPKAVVTLLASNDPYLIVSQQPSIEELNAGKAGDAMKLYVLHRDSHQWESTEVEGFGGIRLFGPWITDNVALWNSRHLAKARKKAGLKPRPYDKTEGYIFPGVLILQNLTDGRKIRIFTDHEDCEVLSIDGDTLVYRVENSLYRANIAKDVLQDTTLLLQEPDVAKLHWAFWTH